MKNMGGKRGNKDLFVECSRHFPARFQTPSRKPFRRDRPKEFAPTCYFPKLPINNDHVGVFALSVTDHGEALTDLGLLVFDLFLQGKDCPDFLFSFRCHVNEFARSSSEHLIGSIWHTSRAAEL